MRIDVKTVRNNKYLQFINKDGNIFHIGSASDFESWLISAIVWDQQWTNEYYERREDFFSKLENEMERHLVIDDFKKESFMAIRSQKVYPSWIPSKKLRVPKIYLFGQLRENENIKQRRFRPMKWCPNDLGAKVQKRLDEISSKNKRLVGINENTQKPRRRETQPKVITGQLSRNHKATLDKVQRVLSVVIEIEREKGTASIDEVTQAKALVNEMQKEEIEKIILQLLREGTIYEPGEGRLKKT